MKAKTQPVLSVSINDLYPDRFDVDDDDYDLEDEPILNLGAESIAPTPPPEPADGSYFPTSIAPARGLNNRKSRLSPSSPLASRNCDLCSKQAITSQSQCCGRFFCQDHFLDWLRKPSSHCPSCALTCPADNVKFHTYDSRVMPYAAVPSSLRNSVKTSQEDSDLCSESSNSNASSEERGADSDSDSAEVLKADHEALSFLQNVTSSVIDPELAGGVVGNVGKVLSIVALTLVFYVLSS